MESVSLSLNQITFRHPFVKDKNGYPKPFCKAVAKLTPSDQGRPKEGLIALLEAKPRLRSEAPKELHKMAYDLWFDAMNPKGIDVSKLKAKDIPDADHSVMPDQHRSNNTLSTLNDALKRNQELESIIAGMTEHVGALAHFSQTAQSSLSSIQVGLKNDCQ